MAVLLKHYLEASIESFVESHDVRFPALFAAALRHAGLSQNAAGPFLGCTGPYINQLVNGKAKPPLDQIERWADLLKIDGLFRDSLILAAHLDRTSPLIAGKLEELEAQIECLSAELSDLRGLARQVAEDQVRYDATRNSTTGGRDDA